MSDNNIEKPKKNPTKCTIVNVNNKLTEVCKSKKTCKVINNVLECPGYDNGGNYSSIENIGEDISGSISGSPNEDILDGNMRIPVDDTYIDPIINNAIKNSISTRINSMNYSQVSENIKKRYKRLSGEEASQTASNAPTVGEINLVKNQEESASTLQMSEHEMPVVQKVEKMTLLEEKTEQILEESPIKKFWNKYKLWIIGGLILLLIIFIGVYIYSNSGKTPNAPVTPASTIKVDVASPSPTNLSPGPNIKNIFLPAKSTAEIKTSSDMPSVLPTTSSSAAVSPSPVEVVAPVVSPPVKAPIAAPIVAPVTTPIKAPVTAPIKAPVTVPIKAPVTVPVTAPVAVPVTAPIAAPVVGTQSGQGFNNLQQYYRQGHR